MAAAVGARLILGGAPAAIVSPFLVRSSRSSFNRCNGTDLVPTVQQCLACRPSRMPVSQDKSVAEYNALLAKIQGAGSGSVLGYLFSRFGNDSGRIMKGKDIPHPPPTHACCCSFTISFTALRGQCPSRNAMCRVQCCPVVLCECSVSARL